MLKITSKQKLILYLISCDPGIRDVYTMVRIYDRADFPSNISENLRQLLDKDFIYVTQYFNNGTPNKYAITDKGKEFINNNINYTEIIEYIRTLDKPDQLLEIAQLYIDKKGDL